MSDETETNALVAYEEQLKRELAGLKDQVEGPSSNMISTKGKVFTLPDGKASAGPLLCVVLDFIALNQWYSGVYNPNARSPADCLAINRIIKDLAPDASSPKPQSASCEGCPRNAWGTGVNGNGKACKNQRRLVIVPANFFENPKIEPMTIHVSPTGIKHWDKYVRELASDMGAMPVQVITEISFDPAQSYPSLLFSLEGKHGHLGAAMGLRAKYQEMLMKVPDLKRVAA